MDQNGITRLLLSQAGNFRQLGATSLYLFGSRARGDHHESSDLDLFIDYEPTNKIPSLFSMMDWESQLSQQFGVQVDLTTRDSLHYYVREEIVKEAIRIF